MRKRPLLMLLGALVLLLGAVTASADEALEVLGQNERIAAFRTEYLYDNDVGTAIGARFRHIPSGMILDVLRIQSVPQAYMWVNTPPSSDKGEPHTCEHLLLGKGNKGRYVASLEDMSLGNSSASTYRLFTNYHFHTAAGGDVFYELFEAKLDALLHPNFTDEEIRREVRNMGVVVDPVDSSLDLEEKGTVYTEMVSSFERPGTRLWCEMLRSMYGVDHPIANVSGGTPEALRQLTPEDMWKFHADCYQLSNMGIIVSIPGEYDLDEFLVRISDILARLDPDVTLDQDPGTLDSRLPRPKPAEVGSSVFVEFPHQNVKEPGSLVFGWPPTLELDFNEKLVIDLFLANLASGQTSNLHKKFIDSQTREMDIGANSVWASRMYDCGNPIYVWFGNVSQDALSESTIDSVRQLVVREIERIAEFEDGSDELKAFNQRILNRVIERRREIRTFLSSPPRFGYRGLSNEWMDFLKGLQNMTGFRRDLTMRERFEFVEDLLSQDKNFWRDRIHSWGLLDFEPYTLATVPNPDLLEQELEGKETRIAEFVENLKSKYNTESDEEAIRDYSAEYTAKTEELEKRAQEIAMPTFVDNPPMTLDDQLDYRVEQLPGGGPLVVSTFETMTGATFGLAFDMSVIPESLLVYAAALPILLDEVGVIEDGKPVSYDDMQERIRQEILWVRARADVRYSMQRAELIVAASGSSSNESQKAGDWLELILLHPDWRPENLPRIRDAIDLNLKHARNTMKGSEESWVYNPAYAYWRQSNPLILTADCFLTRTHAMQRIRWMLKEASTAAIQEEFSQFMADLASAGDDMSRTELEDLLAAISGSTDAGEESPIAERLSATLRDASEETRLLVMDAAQDLTQNLNEMPDATIRKDWRYLCTQIVSDLATEPQKVLDDAEYLMDLIRRQDNVRSYAVSSSSLQQTVLPKIHSIASELSKEPSVKQQYSDTPLIHDRLMEHTSDPSSPVYVGLVNKNTQSGVIISGSKCAGFQDYDREGLLDFLACKLYSGGGAHSMFMKTWSAGLAYSNGLRSSEYSGRSGYYAERCPDLAQTLRFVVNELQNAPYDSTLADYAVAQAFQSSRAGSDYEYRGAAMAADLADGITPKVVQRFRKAVLELAKGSELYDNLEEPGLYDQLRSRMLSVYGRVLPGLDPPGSAVDDAFYFIIGPEKQFKSFEEYVHGTEGDVTVHRLYPRDYWIVGNAASL